MVVHDEVRESLESGRPVVALESTIIAHGLPRPDNLRVAREVEAAVREHGAVPATIAILGGEVRVGLDEAALESLAEGGAAKCGVRDLAPVVARGGDGATTVAATAHLAERAGISVFATGGLGGVHRGARDTFDESADLATLARVSICVVCAGVKSILDIPATLERLETLGIGVAGYRTAQFPAFYLTDSGHTLPWRLDTPQEIADAALGDLAGKGERLQRLVVEPDPDLAAEDGDRRGHGAMLPHHRLDLPRHAQVVRPRQPVGDDRALERHDRLPGRQRRLNFRKNAHGPAR